MIDDLDDAAAVTDAVLFLDFLNAQQNAVVETGSFARARFARDMNADFRGGPVRLLVPFVGRGDEIAFCIARGHVGEHSGGHEAGVMDFLAALFD